MSSALPGATFRDPAGSLTFEDGQVLRRIGDASRAEVLDLLAAPFIRDLQQRGDLIDAVVDNSGDTLTLRHPRVPIPTYPWEWTPAQWLAAAELTLNLCDQALDAGWILKDATPLNILFVGPRPIFVDILSFERRDPGSSLWLAYGQYVRTFLLPLLMDHTLRWPLALSLFRRDGYEPADCYAALSWSQRLSRAALWPVTLPALLDRRQNASAPPPATKVPARAHDPEVATRVLKRTLNDLRRRTRRVAPQSSSSQWSAYTSALTHYTPQQTADKLAWVRTALQSARTVSESAHPALASAHPASVLDIGANTGDFSALAAESGAHVVALERDPAAADRLFRMARDRGLSILTLCADIARPTPAAGWNNAESPALLPRLEGQFDLVLLLAVIHHLILMDQIPIPAILALCHRLTRRHLIVEWVPVDDPMFKSLMRGRDALYGSLSEADLLAACAGRFTVLDRHALTNGRVLFLLDKIA